MKADWEVKTLGECVKFIDYRGKTPEKFSSGLRLITAKNVKNGYLQKEPEEFVNPKIYDAWMTRGIPKVGDILFTTEAPLANVAQLDTDEKVVFAQRIIVLQPYANKLNQTFLKYLLLSETMRKQILSQGTGATVQGIKASLLRQIEIKFPQSLAEQQRIVAILDEAFAAIDKAKENAQKNLRNARELFDSYLQSVFANPGEDWKEKTLAEVCNFFNGFAFKSNDAIEESNTQLVRMGNLYRNKLDLERSPVYYPDDFVTSHKRYLLKENDLIISLTGTAGKEDYGFTVKITPSNKNLLLNQRIAKILILDENKTLKEFLYHFLTSKSFLKKLYKTANGTRQANLSTEVIKKMKVNLPSFDEQQSIVTKLDSLSTETKKLEAIYQQKLTDLDELKKAFLQKAFRGELTATSADAVTA